MDPVIGAGLLTGGMSLLGGERQNAANAQQARQQRNWQERMSNTAYQRATADMRAAGLNPALAYQQGGAGTPPGAQAHMENTLGPAATNATASMHSRAQLQQAQAQTKLIDTEQRIKEFQSQYHNAMLANQSTREAILTQLWGHPEYKGLLLNKMKEDLRLTTTHARQGEQDMRIKSPEEWKSQTRWGSRVSPFMNDARAVLGMGTAIATPFAIGRAGKALKGRVTKPAPRKTAGGNSAKEIADLKKSNELLRERLNPPF